MVIWPDFMPYTNLLACFFSCFLMIFTILKVSVVGWEKYLAPICSNLSTIEFISFTVHETLISWWLVSIDLYCYIVFWIASCSSSCSTDTRSSSWIDSAYCLIWNWFCLSFCLISWASFDLGSREIRSLSNYSFCCFSCWIFLSRSDFSCFYSYISLVIPAF